VMAAVPLVFGLVNLMMAETIMGIAGLAVYLAVAFALARRWPGRRSRRQPAPDPMDD
jgi:hypothetical protein